MQSTTQTAGINGMAGQTITNARLNTASITIVIMPKIKIINRTIIPIMRDNNLSKKFAI